LRMRAGSVMVGTRDKGRRRSPTWGFVAATPTSVPQLAPGG